MFDFHINQHIWYDMSFIVSLYCPSTFHGLPRKPEPLLSSDSQKVDGKEKVHCQAFEEPAATNKKLFLLMHSLLDVGVLFIYFELHSMVIGEKWIEPLHNGTDTDFLWSFFAFPN